MPPTPSSISAGSLDLVSARDRGCRHWGRQHRAATLLPITGDWRPTIGDAVSAHREAWQAIVDSALRLMVREILGRPMFAAVSS
jgi:hypothetical protein